MSTTPALRLTPAEIRERIGRLPRIPFAFTPTPLEEAPRLSAVLGGPRILIKRDDLTGFAFGGNKVRAIEFRLGHVKANGYDAFVLVNIGQSNHARLHSAACARLGIKMVIVKPGPKGERIQGNLLLDHLCGAEIIEAGTTDPAELEALLDRTLDDLRQRGYKPYPSTREPFSPIAGTIAFTEASIELVDQLNALGATASRVFLAGGASAAGLGLGGKVLGASYTVHPVSTGASKASLLNMELNLSNRVASEVLDLPKLMTEDDFTVLDEYVGRAYGDATPAVVEAIRLAARTEGLFLDPVYTGKAMSGLIGEIRKGNISKDETVVFVHTGGTPAIFAYEDVLAAE
ncbi:MAG TPA: pyridoxal-phosphate dependent enzyme [Chloroflexota bacterium]|nr:pyridoxal-phosphate dependent enzyme [Chloroflexota bacterium]